MLIQDLKNCVVGSGRSGYWLERATDSFVTQSELSRWHKGKLNEKDLASMVLARSLFECLVPCVV